MIDRRTKKPILLTIDRFEQSVIATLITRLTVLLVTAMIFLASIDLIECAVDLLWRVICWSRVSRGLLSIDLAKDVRVKELKGLKCVLMAFLARDRCFMSTAVYFIHGIKCWCFLLEYGQKTDTNDWVIIKDRFHSLCRSPLPLDTPVKCWSRIAGPCFRQCKDSLSYCAKWYWLFSVFLQYSFSSTLWNFKSIFWEYIRGHP